MAADTLSPVVQYLRRITAPPPSPDLSDGELLDTGRIVLRGGMNTSATLYRAKLDGLAPERITGKVIRFWLGTRDLRFSIEN